MPTVNIVTGLAKEFGYGEVYFEGLNEVSGEHLEHGRPLFEMIRRARTPVPAKVYNSAGKLYDVYDGVRCSLLPAADDIKKYQATGRFVYIYANPHSGQEQPYTYRRNVGLLAKRDGAVRSRPLHLATDVQRDAQRPCSHVALAFVGRQALAESHGGLLDGVGRGVDVAEHRNAEAVPRVLQTANQFRQRLAMPGPGPPQDPFVAGRCCRGRCHRQVAPSGFRGRVVSMCECFIGRSGLAHRRTSCRKTLARRPLRSG